MMWYVYRSTQYLELGLYILGLVLMILACVRFKRLAHVVLAVFFALSVAGWVVNQTDLRNRLVGMRYSQVPKELRPRFEALCEEVETVTEKYPDVLQPTVARMDITFPAGPLLLVLGLLLVLRDQKGITQQSHAEATSKSAQSAASEASDA